MKALRVWHMTSYTHTKSEAEREVEPLARLKCSSSRAPRETRTGQWQYMNWCGGDRFIANVMERGHEGAVKRLLHGISFIRVKDEELVKKLDRLFRGRGVQLRKRLAWAGRHMFEVLARSLARHTL